MVKTINVDHDKLRADNSANAIWGYVRLQKDSLDSERATGFIRDEILFCLKGAQKEIDQLKLQLEGMKKLNSELRKALKDELADRD